MIVTYCSICNAPDEDKPCKLYGNITDCWFWNDTIEIKDEDFKKINLSSSTIAKFPKVHYKIRRKLQSLRW